MVISKVDEESKNNSKSNKKEDQSLKGSPSLKSDKGNRVYTCGELEALNKSKTASKNIKKFRNKHSPKDPAIMQFSIHPDTKMRYDMDELKKLRGARMSQSPPACLYNPHIIRLNILKYTNEHPEDYENQLKSFRELLPKLSMTSWDPKFLDLLNNYHRSLLYPQYNNSYNSSSLPRSSNNTYNQRQRRVSWSDQKQMESQYDNLPSYNQKNFFDNITTATTMRPPPQQKYRHPYPQTKGYSCASERMASYPMNCSGGSMMNETKSSYDESMDRTASTETSDLDLKNERKMKTGSVDDNEPEPEWFSCPASRQDVIDLRGFEDDEGYRGNSTDEIDRSGERNVGSKMFSDFNTGNANQRQNYNKQKNFINNGAKLNYHHQQQQQRYRHPMHQSTSFSSFNSSGGEQNEFGNKFHNISGVAEIPMNPFFDLWKRKNNFKAADQAHMNNNLNMPPPPVPSGMNYAQKPKAMMTIADVEQAMRNAKQYMKQNRQPPMNGIVQQMFQNATAPTAYQNVMPYPYQMPSTPLNMSSFGFDNFRPGTSPSQEQLQQHTSEILKNAILRKHCNNESK